MRTRQQALVIVASGLILTIFAIITLMPGCDGRDAQRSGESRSDADIPVAVRLANAFVDETATPGVRLRAERFDPVTQRLHDVRVDRRDAMIHADEAQIEIDENAGIARITLIDVIIAELPGRDHEE